LNEPLSASGRLVICVTNLTPRQMQFGTNEGAVPGQRVH
jgi:hypothetical protein